MTQLRHYDNLGTARFITFSCHRRLPLLVSDSVRSIIVSNLERLRTEQSLRILGYVLMPEHIHLVLWPRDGLKLGPAIGRMKALAALEIIEGWRTTSLPPQWHDLSVQRDRLDKVVVWMRRCYDHNCRTRASVIEKIDYCHRNPVSRGLVTDPAEWKWSSFGWYQSERNVPLAIDEF